MIMRTFAVAILFALAATGLASAQMGNPLAEHNGGGCAHNNSTNCQNARKAFANIITGMHPEQDKISFIRAIKDDGCRAAKTGSGKAPMVNNIGRFTINGSG